MFFGALYLTADEIKSNKLRDIFDRMRIKDFQRQIYRGQPGFCFLWRGYIQPRQELLNKKFTWLVHGLLWTFWHLPMGLDSIFSALAIFFILPAIVQIRKNTSIAIVIHSVFGAFGFLSLAFGLVN
jgi:Type II CAAX prenyl endopeptidase Rce1-like